MASGHAVLTSAEACQVLGVILIDLILFILAALRLNCTVSIRGSGTDASVQRGLGLLWTEERSSADPHAVVAPAVAVEGLYVGDLFTFHRSSSSLQSEACNALGVSHEVIHSRIS